MAKVLRPQWQRNIVTNMRGKTIEIVAGPNGSGKTTFAEAFLATRKRKTAFLNPDVIASGFELTNPGNASFAAGRVLLAEIHARIARGESFAFESTLSGKTWLQILAKASAADYQIIIYFLYLDSVKTNIARIKSRVAHGGHHIPTKAVLRRQPRCFHNFWNLYRPIAIDWYVFDNSGKIPQFISSKLDFSALGPGKQKQFESLFLNEMKNAAN